MSARDFERARRMDFERPSRTPKLPTVTDRSRRFYAARQAQLRADRLKRASATRPDAAVSEDEPRA